MATVDDQRRQPARPFRFLMRVPVPWVFILAYLIGVGLEIFVPFHTRSLQVGLIKVLGVVLFLIGAGVAAWGLLVFRKARTTTVPGKSSTAVVMSGPYRFSRNPMYCGLIIAYVGEAGLLVQVWPLIILLLVVAYLNWIVIPVEESRLQADFGAEYEQYRARVHRWI
jgi:protein-S-isoprenylcysteine O-methyltransferase Ste14